VKAVAPAALMLLAACSGPAPDDTATPSPTQGAAAAGEQTIECAIGGAAYLGRDCKVEETSMDGTKILVVRHPDGGFRRFAILNDGRGLATADGAEQAETSIEQGYLDVSVGSDRYRFPATIRTDAGNR
jgi:hypothetical protein